MCNLMLMVDPFNRISMFYVVIVAVIVKMLMCLKKANFIVLSKSVL